MSEKKSAPTLGSTTSQSSVRFRVLSGLAVIMILFTALSGYSMILHRRTVAEINVINTAYLTLTLETTEIRKTQLVFNTMLDRLVDDSNRSVTREWIDTARQFRPATLRRLMSRIDETLMGDLPDDDFKFITKMRRRLSKVQVRYASNEKRFVELYDLMETGRLDDARFKIEGLKRVERLLDRVLAGIVHEVDEHITELADNAAHNGNRAAWSLGLLTLAALLIAGVVALSINRLLIPLRTLLLAVAKVARGDLSTHIDAERKDEIGQLADGFNRMTRALAERDQMLIRSERLATAGKMAAQVTHEIRNPLSSLGLNAELLEEELPNDGEVTEARELLLAMQTEIERLTGITESYLRFARMPSPEPVFDNLNDLVESTLSFMGYELEGGNMVVAVHLDTNLEQVFFDAGQIRQSLINLIRNACEAMPEGGSLNVITRALERGVELEVADAGHGIPKEQVGQIFESFYSTKNSGTGLGLPLVRQICLAHGGDIRYEDNKPEGSRFIIQLPRDSGPKEMKDD